MKNKIAQEWFERAQRDFETAKLIYHQRGYLEEVVFLIHQAIEKYLKGYLIFNGWKLKKIHDIETLLNEEKKYNNEFTEFLDFGRILTEFYYEERYLPGPISEISKDETKKLIEHAEKIIEIVKKETGL